MSSIFEPLAQLAGQRQADLDSAIAAWRAGAGTGGRLWCGPGCGNCCTLTVNVTLPEAMAIAGSLDDALRARLAATAARVITHAAQCPDARAFLTGYRQAVGPCPFLDAANHCMIYERRPLACRALLSTRPPAWCGVNLAELPGIERDAFLASLDREIVAFPTHYAAAPQELAVEFERGLVFATIRFAGFAVTGSLPILTWLVGEPGCAEALSNRAAFLTFTADHRVNHPFLLQLHAP